MASHKQQEDYIKKTLKNMPDVNQISDKDELYQRISTKMNGTKKKRKKLVFIPVFSTVFFGLIMFVVLSNNYSNYSVQNDQLKEQASLESAALEESANNQTKMIQKSELTEVTGNNENEFIVQKVIRDERVIHGKVFDTKSDYVIPVSFVFPSNNASIKDQVQGFKRALTDKFPGDQYKYKIDEGNLYKSSQEEITIQKASYKLYKNPENQIKMLVPSKKEGNLSIEMALLEMKSGEGKSYIYPTIPMDVSFTVEEHDDSLTIYFDNSSSIVSKKQHQLMIEAMLSTAKSYGYTHVRFENPMVDQVGPYNLTGEIKVPVAINPISVSN